MKTSRRNQRELRVTLLEMTMIIIILSFLVAMLILGIKGGKTNSTRISCVNGLRQIGLEEYSWVADHSGEYFFELPKTNDETNERRRFQLRSNELATLEVLIFAAESNRLRKNAVAFTNHL
jgi:hypothetical protein